MLHIDGIGPLPYDNGGGPGAYRLGLQVSTECPEHPLTFSSNQVTPQGNLVVGAQRMSVVRGVHWIP